MLSLHGSQSDLVVKFERVEDFVSWLLQLNLQPPPEYEIWSERWLAFPIACLFEGGRREEWLGDLYEVLNDLQERDYPQWLVNAIIISRTVGLVASAVQIFIADLLDSGLFRKP